MTVIRSRAELLRIIHQQPTIRVVEHWQEHLRNSVRRPKTVRNNGKRGIQSNGYYFDGIITQGGKEIELFAPIPKAADLAFNPDGTVTFYLGQARSWRLEFTLISRADS